VGGQENEEQVLSHYDIIGPNGKVKATIIMLYLSYKRVASYRLWVDHYHKTKDLAFC
jgi:hypothetical protein